MAVDEQSGLVLTVDRLKGNLHNRNLIPTHGKIIPMTAKLILRNREYEVKAGQTLRSALKEAGILPESVVATRQGEVITEDEILRDGDVIKLIAVISGGAVEER